jgi:hypothetical protein
MKRLFFLLFLLPFNLFSQINVHKAGDGWDSMVYSAINLIKKTSPYHYAIFRDVVQEVQFWNEDYSSNNLVEGKGIIVISSKDIKLNSINNLAAALVHESYHLKVLKYGPDMAGREEEYLCYVHELKLLKLLPNAEPDLLAYTKEQVKLWNIK